jgi:hypothetical protein
MLISGLGKYSAQYLKLCKSIRIHSSLIQHLLYLMLLGLRVKYLLDIVDTQLTITLQKPNRPLIVVEFRP